MDRVRVMVVNDSPYMRKLLSDIIAGNDGFEVCETAADGAEALRKLRLNKPDVVLLDLEMPNMDGLSFIEQAMKTSPVPIIVVSGYGQRGAQVVLDALESGAVDFVSLPDEPSKMKELASNLTLKIRLASKTNIQNFTAQKVSNAKPQAKRSPPENGAANKVVVIGGSTGSPRIISKIMSELPEDLPAGVLIVQHMPNTFTSSFAQRLNSVSGLTVKEANDGDVIKSGTALLAPGDYHMVVKPNRRVELNKGPRRFGVRPSVNVSMISASEVYGPATVGVLLSGMGHDGAFGMKMIKKRGGYTIAQDAATSVVFGMAKAAYEMHAVDKLLPVDEIPEEIVRAVRRGV